MAATETVAKSERDLAYEAFAAALSKLRTDCGTLSAREATLGIATLGNFTGATVDLAVKGLDAWLASGAEDRRSAALDRADQKKARWVAVGVSIAILLAAVVNLMRP